MAGSSHDALCGHLIRSDGQEDVCFALWRPSEGVDRLTAIVGDAILPEDGERRVAGTAWITGEYAIRAARLAAEVGAGIAFLHSHPRARTWQSAVAGSADADTEKKLANLAREFTGLPMVGLTLSAASQFWSGRIWDQGRGSQVAAAEVESVRVFGPTLRPSFHPLLVPIPSVQPSQLRSVNSWGDEIQATLARLRVLVVGGGSVGQLVLEMLARTGIQHIGVMDFDTVEFGNLDRLHGATMLDARLLTSKVELASRLLDGAATASPFCGDLLEMSVCESGGMKAALDYDVIFSCVDRPWPRHVLNTMAYSDVIPVIDGGIRLEPGSSGGLRNAYWCSHIAGPSRTCLRCLEQYNVADVQLERDGSLDDPSYIANLPPDSPLRTRQNVFAVSLAAASSMTNQFLSLVVAPSGFGDPGPLRYDLRRHTVESVTRECEAGCSYSGSTGRGDFRADPSGPHPLARIEIERRTAVRRRGFVRFARVATAKMERLPILLGRVIGEKLRVY